MNSDLTEMLWRDLAIFLLIGALLGIAIGWLLIFKPQLLPSINRKANRWISLRQAGRVLNQGVSIEHGFYRHHRLLGVFIILGAGYTLVHFGVIFDTDVAQQYLAGFMPAKLAEGLLDALVFTSLLGAAVALFAGLLLWLRPNTLHRIEKTANLWVSSRRATKVFDIQHNQIDHYVEHHTRLTGWLLFAGSAYLFLITFGLLV